MEELNITKDTTRNYIDNRIAEYYKYYEDNRENTNKKEIDKIGKSLIKQVKEDWHKLDLAGAKKIILENSAVSDYSEFIHVFRLNSKDPFNIFSEIDNAKTWYDNIKKE